MIIGSLFSGIGGLELGLERAGCGETRFQVEMSEFCRSVLARHWPDAQRYADVRHFHGVTGQCDLLCGGFPCQDLSDASHGAGAGLKGERSGLWSEFMRIINEIKPMWVVVENVSGAAAKRWLPIVRRDFHGGGYSSVPIQLRGIDIGAPLIGARIFVVAAPNGYRKPTRAKYAKVEFLREFAKLAWREWGDAPTSGLGVADGFSCRMGRERLTAYGNAVMPAMAEVIGRMINAVESSNG